MIYKNKISDNMIGIHCFSSKPMLHGRSINGTFGGASIELPEYIILILKLSALEWKKTNGKIILYTDTPMKEYLEKKNMLLVWDEVNTEILDSFEEEYPNINQTVFWSAAKFACYKKEQSPFVCLDTDLIVWKKLNFSLDMAFAFSHWELIEDNDINYPYLSELVTPIGYKIYDGCNFCNRASNMSITYFGNDEFKNAFITEAFSFMTNNLVDCKKRYATPEILYMEQRLPLAIANRMKLKYQPIINSVWSPKQSKFTEFDPEYGDFFFAKPDETKPFTHLWFYKNYLQNNTEARIEYISELKIKLAQFNI
jgi:hypothetical protein